MTGDGYGPRRIVRTWVGRNTPTGDYYAQTDDGRTHYVYGGGGGQPYDGTGSQVGTTDGRFLYPKRAK